MTALSAHSEDERLARRINPLLHVPATNYKEPGWFDSLKIIYKSLGTHRIYHPTERPPYPILMDKFKFSDIFPYFQKGDLVLFGFFYLNGLIFGYLGSRGLNAIQSRVVIFHGIAHAFNVTGLVITFLMPCYRISGYWENGLRWRRPAPMKRYDFTSNLDTHPLYKHFRVQL